VLCDRRHRKPVAPNSQVETESVTETARSP
jgi:hypothetical protein